MSDIISLGLERLSRGERFSREEAFSYMDVLMQGGMTPAQIGATLMALRVRGESVEEIAGFAQAMRKHAVAVPVRRRPLIDTCGTGGDRSFTFNVSTVSAFVVAGAGLGVAKHGNRSATSKSGSADLLEALDISIQSDPIEVGRLIDEVGFGFLFAQQMHSSMRHVALPRRELGFRTIFNVLGPLTNPCSPDYQLLGVFSPEWVGAMAEVLALLGVKRGMVVHGHGGLDEVSLSGPTAYGFVKDGEMTQGQITPEQLGLPVYPSGSFVGGDPVQNAQICRDILCQRTPGPLRDLVLANAGVALFVGNVVDSLRDGVNLARETIENGRAEAVLNQLIGATHLQRSDAQ